MERELLIQWGMTAFIFAAMVAVVTFSVWAIVQALKPVEQPVEAYDVLAEASRIAMRRWYRQEDEVA